MFALSFSLFVIDDEMLRTRRRFCGASKNGLITNCSVLLRKSQAFSTVFPLICGRASEEVRKSISVDLMSSLSTNQKIDLLVDSDEEEVTLF